jgi:hypothetical protein
VTPQAQPSAERGALVAPLVLALLLSPLTLAAWIGGQALLRWTGWRPWRLAVPAAATVALVVVVEGGPVPALQHHFAALLGLVGQFGRPVVHLPRPGALLMPQAPLSLPVGALAAAATARLAPARPEWAEAEQRRRGRLEVRSQRRASVLAARSTTLGTRVPSGRAAALAVHVQGDLPAPWRAGRYVVLPGRVAGLPRLVIGQPGGGKSVYLTREAYLDAVARRRLVVVDGKGEPDFAEQVVDAYLAGNPAATVHSWPAEPLDAWQGEPAAVANRLLGCWEFTPESAYYREVASLALRLALHAPDDPVTSSAELAKRMQPGALERLWHDHPDQQKYIRALGREMDGVCIRVANLMASLGGFLDGGRGIGDADLTVISLPTMAAEHDASAILRVLLGDLAHWTSVRKPRGLRAGLIVDEFSAVAGGRQQAIHLLERGRSAGVATVLAAQSRRSLGDEVEADRLIGAAAVVVLFATPEPEDLLKLAGTVRTADLTWQLDGGRLTGRASASTRSAYRVDANVVRALLPGQAVILAGGRASLVQVLQPPPAERPVPSRRALPWPRRKEITS